MEKISNTIGVGYSDGGINAILEALSRDSRPSTRHFSQGEDFFLKLEEEFTVPHFPIHHDVRRAEPSAEYLRALSRVLEQVAALAPQTLRDLAYFFDPAEILRPCFFKLYRIDDSAYLYLLRVDLAMKASDCTVVRRGTNDTTAEYRSRKLFLENTVVPLSEVLRDEQGRVKALRVRQTISQTWIGEFGRGYFQQGIWMDLDLTRFFSRLFLPAAKRTYPFYPFLCKYKTVCQSVIDLSPEGRTTTLPSLHRAIGFLLPAMEAIQSEMRHGGFAEDMKIFRDLKARVPEAWYEPWKSIRVESYLNESEMKEFRVDD
ncbi:MAG: hypothetical protein NT005_14755 [Spirochaetes bacterium]|nr:hypothetical protein [Spirochaetota bacterium]